MRSSHLNQGQTWLYAWHVFQSGAPSSGKRHLFVIVYDNPHLYILNFSMTAFVTAVSYQKISRGLICLGDWKLNFCPVILILGCIFPGHLSTWHCSTKMHRLITIKEVDCWSIYHSHSSKTVKSRHLPPGILWRSWGHAAETYLIFWCII